MPITTSTSVTLKKGPICQKCSKHAAVVLDSGGKMLGPCCLRGRRLEEALRWLPEDYVEPVESPATVLGVDPLDNVDAGPRTRRLVEAVKAVNNIRRSRGFSIHRSLTPEAIEEAVARRILTDDEVKETPKTSVPLNAPALGYRPGDPEAAEDMARVAKHRLTSVPLGAARLRTTRHGEPLEDAWTGRATMPRPNPRPDPQNVEED